jgi:hypothetical protein
MTAVFNANFLIPNPLDLNPTNCRNSRYSTWRSARIKKSVGPPRKFLSLWRYFKMGKWFFHSHQGIHTTFQNDVRFVMEISFIFHNKSLSLSSEHYKLESNFARNFKSPASYSFWSHLALRRRGFHRNKTAAILRKTIRENNDVEYSEPTLYNLSTFMNISANLMSALKMYDWAFYVLRFTTADDCSLSSFQLITKSWDIKDLLSTPLAYARIS